ncbi:hypothetical protein PT974_02294 [Cladobotryum mycophilum]|uniref:non-specific serine/threonine protein kinase n=1 Tax=Cladobotryum mycophilum TaxID=491253 RepID=A0ABR0SYY6_9HYPO
MNEQQLGFDPTIITSGDKRFIEIKREDRTERLIIEKSMGRRPCIAGRATTCWKAYYENDPQTPLVIKDSWQFPERQEEGELLQEATDKGVINVARHYYHETVKVLGMDDDVRNSVRKGLDISKAENYQRRPVVLLDRSDPRVRPALFSPWKTIPFRIFNGGDITSNRIHRRVILRDYGTPIYKASSRAALLKALKGCIEGYESLHKAGFLHRDISIYNLMVNEDENNPSWPSFLIDLDLAIKEQRASASGAKGKTGTRAFMAVGVLLGDLHSFMHDLESFFWVLFWICIHYNGPGLAIGPTRFDHWNYENDQDLADLKFAAIIDERTFLDRAERDFTPYYEPLIPWVNRLRREVFPNGKIWKKEDRSLYGRMNKVLEAATKAEEA